MQSDRGGATGGEKAADKVVRLVPSPDGFMAESDAERCALLEERLVGLEHDHDLLQNDLGDACDEAARLRTDCREQERKTELASSNRRTAMALLRQQRRQTFLLQIAVLCVVAAGVASNVIWLLALR
jgi:hypothetical protein